MCNRYVSPAAGDIERYWNLRPGHGWRMAEVYPRAPGPFIRSATGGGEGRELVVGQWGLIPWFAKTAKLTYSTNNARHEGIANKPSYKQSWRAGRRCIIPALSFDEPNWETGKNVWWRFHRADGAPWGLAGLWNAWTDKATGEVIESYTMLTINADTHPLMSRMHKPDPRLAPDQQDKRSVVPIEPDNADIWLNGTVENADGLVQLAPAERFSAAAVPSAAADKRTR